MFICTGKGLAIELAVQHASEENIAAAVDRRGAGLIAEAAARRALRQARLISRASVRYLKSREPPPRAVAAFPFSLAI